MTRFHLPRRRLLLGGGATLLVSPWLSALRADQVNLNRGAVQFHPEIEPLVRILESTPREELFKVVAQRIRTGTSYTEWLTATLLAGIRNVQPRPNVGFKFHCVMVVHAAHQATLAARDEHRWFPLFWSMDYFKRCQAQDESEGDWTMPSAPSVQMSPEQALKELEDAFEAWDVERADRAATAASNLATAGQLFEIFARFSARDFRNIGHKAIWVAGAFRTLETIGWEHAEPVMRSLAFAILNHSGEPNPADHDLEADRAGRANWERVRGNAFPEIVTTEDDAWSEQWLQSARTESADRLAAMTAAGMQQGVSPRSIYHAIQGSAAELVMRQPAIVPLHAITSTNAIHHLVRTVQDRNLKRWLLLQNAAFIGHFRAAAAARGNLGDADLLALRPAENSNATAEEIFEQVGVDRVAAAGHLLAYLERGESASELLRTAREQILLKGTDSHDYKYSASLFEEVRFASPAWRARIMAAGSHLLTGSRTADNGLAQRLAEAFA